MRSCYWHIIELIKHNEEIEKITTENMEEVQFIQNAEKNIIDVSSQCK